MIGDMPYFDITTGIGRKVNVKANSANGNGKRWKTAGFFGRLNTIIWVAI